MDQQLAQVIGQGPPTILGFFFIGVGGRSEAPPIGQAFGPKAIKASTYNLVRRLDRIRVKGKARPVEIFQLSDDRWPATRALFEAFEAALEPYFAGDFAAASWPRAVSSAVI